MTPILLLVVALAGGIGAGLRYLVQRAFAPGGFPFGVLVVNVTGSFALGFVTALAAAGADSSLVTVIGTGLLGGYTTFSTVAVETVTIAEQRRFRLAALNVLGTVVTAVPAAALGMWVGMLVAGPG